MPITCTHTHRRSELESKELVAEMVTSFLLPEVEKQTNREKGRAIVVLCVMLCLCVCERERERWDSMTLRTEHRSCNRCYVHLLSFKNTSAPIASPSLPPFSTAAAHSPRTPKTPHPSCTSHSPQPRGRDPTELCSHWEEQANWHTGSHTRNSNGWRTQPCEQQRARNTPFEGGRRKQSFRCRQTANSNITSHYLESIQSTI